MIDTIANSYGGRMPFKAWSRRAAYFPLPTNNHADFTLLVTEANVPADFFSIVQNGGGDIRCAWGGSRGFTQIDIEVVECNTSTNKLQLWVKVPLALNFVIIPLYLYYGHPTASFDPAFSNAWQSWYTNVYHLEETSGNFIDSTTNNNDMTPEGTLPNAVTGIVGDGQELNGTSDAGIFTRPVQDDFTLMCFIKSTDDPPNGSQWHQGNGLIDGEVAGVVNDFGMSIIDAGVLAGGIGNSDTTLKGTTLINDGNWHMCAMRRIMSSGFFALNVDGVNEGNGSGNTNSLTAPTNLTMGRIMTGGKYFDGEMDEVRIMNTETSDEFLEDTYDSIVNETSFNLYIPSLSS